VATRCSSNPPPSSVEAARVAAPGRPTSEASSNMPQTHFGSALLLTQHSGWFGVTYKVQEQHAAGGNAATVGVFTTTSTSRVRFNRPHGDLTLAVCQSRRLRLVAPEIASCRHPQVELAWRPLCPRTTPRLIRRTMLSMTLARSFRVREGLQPLFRIRPPSVQTVPP
jgi:hypothetical protein